MKSNNEKYMFTREWYKEIKKFDRQQMEEFCKNLYMEGYKDGKEDIPGIDLEKVVEAISQVKGIGEKRLQNIIDSVSVLFEEQK